MAIRFSRFLIPALCAWGVTPVTAQINGDNFSAVVTLASDYVLRGISQTDGDPAVQGGFDFAHPVGFFAGIWASNVDFAARPPRQEPRDLEIDYYLGYGDDLGGGWSGKATLIRYTYPGSDSSFHYDYHELLVDASFLEVATASVGYVDDIFGSEATALSYGLTGRFPVAERVELGAGVGLLDLDAPINEEYAFWNLGVSLFLGRFAFDVGYFDTDSTAERIFGEAAGGRLVLSITAAIQ